MRLPPLAPLQASPTRRSAEQIKKELREQVCATSYSVTRATTTLLLLLLLLACDYHSVSICRPRLPMFTCRGFRNHCPPAQPLHIFFSVHFTGTANSSTVCTLMVLTFAEID